MSNSPTRGSARKYDNLYYYDQLGPRIRRALQECVTQWDAKWCLDKVRKYGADYVVKMLNQADEDFMRKGFKTKAFEKNHPSSFIAAKVKPLRANW